jgi:hypothetical protein
MYDLSGAAWRKAKASQNNGGCVEIADNLPDVIAIRDSKQPLRGAHVVSRAAFAAFIADAKAGGYDPGRMPGLAVDCQFIDGVL